MAIDASNAPMGANLVEWAATFRVWTPAARTVAARRTFNNWSDERLSNAPAYRSAFVPSVNEGPQYKFFVGGDGSFGYKRDPYARSLTRVPAWPNCNCSVTQPQSFPWHISGFRPAAFNELILYQLHVGAYWSPDSHGV